MFSSVLSTTSPMGGKTSPEDGSYSAVEDSNGAIEDNTPSIEDNTPAIEDNTPATSVPDHIHALPNTRLLVFIPGMIFFLLLLLM